MSFENDNSETIDAISQLRGQEESPKSESAETATEPATSPVPGSEVSDVATVTPEVVDDEQAAEARRNELMREIAMDPYATQRYVQGDYYQPEPEAAAQPVDQGLPFDPEDFDPTDPEHQQALIDARLKAALGPIYEAVDNMKQREQQEAEAQQYQQMQAVEQHVNTKAIAFLDTYVPGFQGIADKIIGGQQLSPVEKAVFNEAVNAESAFIQQYPQARFDIQMRAQIAQAIGPHLKQYAKELGLVAQPRTQLTEAQKQVMKQEGYVESSSAVPATTAGDFDKAHASGDTFQMIRAIRKSR